MSFSDPSGGGTLDAQTAAEMASLLRAAADVVDGLAGCGDVGRRLVLWQELAALMGEFDALVPGFPEP